MPEEETYLGQILVNGEWVDYARGTGYDAWIWYNTSPDDRRVVDWISREQLIP